VGICGGRYLAGNHGCASPHAGYLIADFTFPVVIPLLVAAVKASSAVLGGLPLEELTPWVNILIGYDIIFTAAAFMVFEYVVEE